MEYMFKAKGVCSSSIHLTIEGGIIKGIKFVGGCHGNLQGIEKLVTGMKAEEVANKLKDIKCGFKDTSCPDQLALAIIEALDRQEA
ncbi:MAG: TIGR03905 family TSCPD domain-containing protein [Clostridiales bacterium]|jgi:uncharacterized protein (TIGR03905 family)|nr:TIGR03905 family TSCPD domain-containing protein [Eubacteriales bacterium]MDH7564959.1 TIGR03905 family TSCPD domain-containing protein [Clostridiales bacterium]